MIKPNDICPLSCFDNSDQFYAKLKKVKGNVANTINIPLEIDDNYTVNYSPVGNYPKKPYVIICGKTTSGKSHDLFIDALQKGKSLHEACFSAIYANKMRDNLFEYLSKIGLFDCLAKIVPYWNTKYHKKKWDYMFNNLDDSLSSGIQLTQAFNCAILNKNRKKRSSEANLSIFKDIQQNTGCLFQHFRISENLKLIIFLDTPAKNNMFHQIYFWQKKHGLKKYEYEVISITHPSPQNMDVYNHLDDLTQITSNKKKKAIELFENAKCVVANLSEDISE